MAINRSRLSFSSTNHQASHTVWGSRIGSDGTFTVPFVWDPDALEIRLQTIGEQPAGRRFSIRVWQPPAPGTGRLAPPAPPR